MGAGGVSEMDENSNSSSKRVGLESEFRIRDEDEKRGFRSKGKREKGSLLRI